MQPTIIYEDNHILAINKPAGWLVQGDRTGDATLTDWGKEYLKVKYNKPGAVFLTPVHRIDRPVSGAVLFARTDKALGRLTTLFRDHKVSKTYYALVTKAPPSTSGELKHYLLKDESRNIVTAYKEPTKDAKESIARYELVKTVGSNFLLQIRPKTGRPHQIRVQLAAMGCPILGDLKYGAQDALPNASIGLHCLRMEFTHPVKLEPVIVEATVPEEKWWARI